MKLNGETIPTPRRNISINEVEIARVERTASGLMVKDIITTKRQFGLAYNGLKPTEAQVFIDAYRAGKPVVFEYTDLEEEQTATVYVMSLPREIYSPKPLYTANVTITLEEK